MGYPPLLDPHIDTLHLCTDLYHWKSEMLYHELENQFFLKLFSSEVIKKAGISEENLEFLHRELKTLNGEKECLFQALGTALIESEEILIKDEGSGSQAGLQHYQKLKVELHNYSFRNRKVKILIHSYLSQGIGKFL